MQKQISDVGSREARRRQPTCPMVQVINGLTRHGGDIELTKDYKRIGRDLI